MGKMNFKSGYSEVNGLKMYYEIYGQGKPFVLIHGGGSTIQSGFEKVIPMFAKSRKVIAIELQAHGRTNDRETGLSFEQDADDVASFLKNMEIEKADILGFSNGGTTALQLAIRHSGMLDKMVLCSALSKRNGVPDHFWQLMKQATLDNMPDQLKQAYLKVNPDKNGLQVMFEKDASRMIHFEDIPDEKIKSVSAPVLILSGDKDIITPEHALEMHRMIPNSRLAIIPGGHGDYIGEVTTLNSDSRDSDFVVPVIEKFLDAKL